MEHLYTVPVDFDCNHSQPGRSRIITFFKKLFALPGKAKEVPAFLYPPVESMNWDEFINPAFLDSQLK